MFLEDKKMKRIFRFIYIGIFILCFSNSVNAQQFVRITGKVIDAITKEPLPFVSVHIVGKNIGTITDYNGYYKIETQWASNQIEASSIGYKKQIKKVTNSSRQEIDFQLEPSNYQLNEVSVKAKKIMIKFRA